MSLIKYQQQLIIKYDLINKFFYKSLAELPKLKKITINLGCNKNLNIKDLATAMLALELISKQKGLLTKSKTADLALKIRKGYPVGCKINLHHMRMYDFIFKLLFYIFPKVKNFYGINIKKRNRNNTITYKLKTTFIFTELEKQHNTFKSLPFLNISFVTTTKSQKELKFLLKSYKLPII